ncbi:hypothetical protein AB1Y20_004072 [Prymnesium parvum]|uniref:Calmodulin-lysine N-methyltransferase n=1 Tax=Prymnesium parvum TaxID=97485 RepID=A0AB34J8L8_PRYPA
MHLSDVHLHAPAAGDSLCLSWFRFRRTAPPDTRSSSPPLDADGDPCVPRKQARRAAEAQPLGLRHAGATELHAVGLQLWRAALLLADHLLSPALADLLTGATVLDLGAGCGLTSIAAALGGARAVFCTDAHLPSLANAAHNASFNGVGRTVRVRRLEWGEGERSYQRGAMYANLVGRGVSDTARWADEPDGPFGWVDEDRRRLARCELVLAADCVYDDEATTALVQTIALLLPVLQADAVCLVALERRVNFCLEGMAPRAPAAEHFERELKAQEHLNARRVPPDSVPQRFEYSRERNLDLWHVTCTPPT